MDTMASDAELNVEQTTGPPVLDKLAKIATNRFTVSMPDKKLEEKLDSNNDSNSHTGEKRQGFQTASGLCKKG